VKIDGDPWFVAKDVCEVLGLDGYASQHTKRLDADECRVITRTQNTSLPIFKGKAPRATLVSESGLYKLIMRSDKPVAKPFQDWVTRTVLPAIRKDGMYVLGEEKVATGEMSIEELALAAIKGLETKIARMKDELENLTVRTIPF
jgi:prophage antirepressor-like protein